jgi:hypothetical protein
MVLVKPLQNPNVRESQCAAALESETDDGAVLRLNSWQRRCGGRLNKIVRAWYLRSGRTVLCSSRAQEHERG